MRPVGGALRGRVSPAPRGKCPKDKGGATSPAPFAQRKGRERAKRCERGMRVGLGVGAPPLRRAQTHVGAGFKPAPTNQPNNQHTPSPQHHQTTTNNPLSPPWERGRLRHSGAPLPVIPAKAGASADGTSIQRGRGSAVTSPRPLCPSDISPAQRGQPYHPPTRAYPARYARYARAPFVPRKGQRSASEANASARRGV